MSQLVAEIVFIVTAKNNSKVPATKVETARYASEIAFTTTVMADPSAHQHNHKPDDTCKPVIWFGREEAKIMSEDCIALTLFVGYNTNIGYLVS